MLTGTRDNPRGTHGMRCFGCQWEEPLWDVASLVHTGSKTAPHQRDTPHSPRTPSSPSSGYGAGPFPAVPWDLAVPPPAPCTASSGQDDAGEWGLEREVTGRLGPLGKDEATHEERTGQGQTRGSLTVHGDLHLLHVSEGQRPRQVPGHRPRAEHHGHGHHQLNLHGGSVSPGSRAPRPAAPGPARRSPAAGQARRCPSRAGQLGTSRWFSTTAAAPAPRRWSRRTGRRAGPAPALRGQRSAPARRPGDRGR